MTRVKTGVTSKKRHKKILKANKGYRQTKSKLYRKAKEAYLKAGQHSYRDRKKRARNFRRLWIKRINAAVGQEGLKYSKFIYGLKKADIQLDRKTLAYLALHDQAVFSEVVEEVKKSL